MTTKSKATAITAIKTTPSEKLTKEQKEFNHQLVTIKVLREEIIKWEKFKSKYQEAVATKIDPVRDEYVALQGKFIILFDEIMGQKHKGNNQQFKKKLTEVICYMSQFVMNFSEQMPTEIELIYKKYRETSKKRGMDEDDIVGMNKDDQLAMMLNIIEMQYDIEFPVGFKPESPDELMEKTDELVNAKVKNTQKKSKKDNTNKEKKPTKKELKKMQEEAELNQSIKEIYRKLASALHPDREPDEIKRQQKNDLMQRVNSAYKENNLLALLELQMEIDSINQVDINNLSQAKLKSYNKILKDQANELHENLNQLMMYFRMEYGIAVPTPEKVIRRINKDSKDMKETIQQTIKELAIISQDFDELKNWVLDFYDERVA